MALVEDDDVIQAVSHGKASVIWRES